MMIWSMLYRNIKESLITLWVNNGVIEKLILSPSKSLFSIKNSTIEISFSKIKKIGEDVILIEYLNK